MRLCSRRTGVASGLFEPKWMRDEVIIGAVGYRFFHQPPELQLVVTLLPSWWGRGLATEACREAIRYGFEEVGFERIAADADPGNEESLRLMERLDMQFEGCVSKGGVDTACYGLGPEHAGSADTVIN